MKAYITNSNSKKVVYNLDLDQIDIDKEIYRIDFDWFSEYELKDLFAFRLLYEHPEEFFQVYKKRIVVDSKQYVFEEKAPSYHYDLNCERLLSSFQNFKIPLEIKNKGDEAISEFRRWFKEHSYLMEDKMDLFLDRLKWKFNLDKRPEAVNYENSGVDIIENLNLNQLDSAIEQLINRAKDFYNSSEMNKIILDEFGKLSFIHRNKKEPYRNPTSYSNDEIWAVLREFDEKYKQPISHLLKEFYKIKYNPDLEFQGELLVQLGFEPCGSCSDRMPEDIVDKNELISKANLPEYDPMKDAELVLLKDKTTISYYELDNPFITPSIKYEVWLRGIYYYDLEQQQRNWILEQLNDLRSKLHQTVDRGGKLLTTKESIGDAEVLAKLIQERREGFLIGKEVIIDKDENNIPYFTSNQKRCYLNKNKLGEWYYVFDTVKYFAERIEIDDVSIPKPVSNEYQRIFKEVKWNLKLPQPVNQRKHRQESEDIDLPF